MPIRLMVGCTDLTCSYISREVFLPGYVEGYNVGLRGVSGYILRKFPTEA